MHRALATVENRLNQTFFSRLLRHCSRAERGIVAAIAANGGHHVPALSIMEPSPHGDWFDESFVKLLGGLARQDLIVLHFSSYLYWTTNFSDAVVLLIMGVGFLLVGSEPGFGEAVMGRCVCP